MTARLPRDERRRQLLDVAYEVVQEEGTGALTLARLAERAGVSKPVAYDHFGTRAGLLAALYRHYEATVNARMRAELAATGGSLATTARVAAATYVDCVLATGPEYDEVCAALLAYEETKDFLQDSRDDYVAEYRRVFAPYANLRSAAAGSVLAGLVGSAEALSHEAHRGAITRDAAVDALTTIMVGALTPYVKRQATA